MTQVRVEPTERDGEHWVTLRAVVRNPAGHTVFVTPPCSTFPGLMSRCFERERTAFGYDVRGPKGGVLMSESSADSSRFSFAPLETKEFLFEFVAADTLTPSLLPPGEYLMRAGYAGRWAEYRPITVVR
jgi:hypothetical protein